MIDKLKSVRNVRKLLLFGYPRKRTRVGEAKVENFYFKPRNHYIEDIKKFKILDIFLGKMSLSLSLYSLD